MIIRLATPRDCNNVLRLLNQLGEIVNERVSFDPDNVRAHKLGKTNYYAAMKRDDQRVFVVDDNEVIVGVATVLIFTDFISGKQYGHIDDFVIDKKRRAQGIGTKLLAYILRYAKEMNMHTVELTSSLPLVEAHRFYEKRGGKFFRKVFMFSL